MSDDKTVSLHLALHPNATLLVSLFQSQDPYSVGAKVKNLDDSRFAIIDARRTVSLNQIVAAANMALQRRNREPVAFDIVLAAAGSTHAGHVTRDYSFGEQDDGAPVQEDDYMILALGLGCSSEEFHSIAKQVGLEGGPQPVSSFSDSHTEEQTTQFIKWYKLTKEEVEMSSLEKAVLTRISTKYL